MSKIRHFLCLLTFLLTFGSVCSEVRVGADRMEQYVSKIKGKRVALVCNQTSRVGNCHLLDTLVSLGIDVRRCFAPEHGMRGDEDAGAHVSNGYDAKTGIEIASVYGKSKKPSVQQLSDIDVVLFDIQDVGARFYTYISTLHYVMEACAENDKKLIVLDRPNPNDTIDGPVLDLKFRSFVGMDKIPLLHGCTVGELAQMINGERWLNNGIKCDLTVIPVEGWKHGQPYSLPIAPSPNLPNDNAIRLYPSLCLFEATPISVGRGTDYPFEVVGYPDSTCGAFCFTPHSMPGKATHPLQENKQCFGDDLRKDSVTRGFSLKFILKYYSILGEVFFSSNSFFDKLSGTDKLRYQILNRKSEEEIRGTWQDELLRYKKMRFCYVLYDEDF